MHKTTTILSITIAEQFLIQNTLKTNIVVLYINQGL